MKKYIIANTRDNMIAEIQTKIMLDGYDLEVKTARTVAGLYKLCENDDITHIILGPHIVLENDFNLSRLMGHPVSGYISKTDQAQIFAGREIPCIGVAKDSDALIGILMQDTLPNMKFEAAHNQDDYIDVDAIELATEENPPLNNRPRHDSSVQNSSVQSTQPTQPMQPVQPVQQQAQPNMPFTQEQMAMFMQFMQQMGMSTPPAPIATQTAPSMQYTSQQQSAPQPTQLPTETTQSKQEKKRKGKSKPSDSAYRQATYAVQNNKAGDDAIARALERDGIYFDTKGRKENASVITVYAAKGGVGKTTIATELAAYLALTSNGRNRLSVCIIDYNIDFGDVCSHLGLNPKGNNMISWAAEIDAMVNDGENPDNISFSESDIRRGYLQRMDKTDLFALFAPIAHEDSMDISDTALKVMLRNIVENGGFDYVVIDTGNNTRDAAIIALEAAEHTLLIATQDLTTANCNSSVLDVLGKMEKKRPGLNTSKIALIINNVIPASEAGVSTRDVEDAFPFPCVAKIKRTPDVLKANNFSRPLIFNAKHSFTHQIQKIVQYVTMGEISNDTYEEKKSRGLARLFKK